MHAFIHSFILGTIGYLGSMSIAVNSLTGPAMLNLPATFSKSGIIPTLATLLFVCILSAMCCLHMANTISKVPQNHNFKKEVEYSEAFQYFWGRNWFVVTQVLFFCCITCLNISSIVDTAHVVDTFLGHWWPNSLGGASVALQIVSISEVHVVHWDYEECSESALAEGRCLPFLQHLGDGSILLTAGNLITSIVFFPMALMDLKENAAGQVFGFVVLLVTSAQFVVQFAMSGKMDWDKASLWGHDWDDLIGVVLFNFALVIAIPAWLYEREPHVDVPTVINGSSIFALILYIVVGLTCHLAVPHVSNNMLESMMSGVFGTAMQLSASIFAFCIIGLGIPLFSVLTRLNLTGSGMFTRSGGNVLAVYLPFAASWLLYDGTAVTKLLAWGGVVFTSLVAFVLPVALALHAVKQFDNEGSISVYYGYFTSKRAELNSLRVILFLTSAAIVAAIAGNIF
jgi:amino acid permease